ncbi:Biotin carboxylase [Paenibacillus polysaccharolyticus]|uniref:Biotin carboxylase n=1 Tax=Paenibacillus polysaccharolyticus TaxID=582692 RepID=A0A1G5E2J7_9BACL|nr:ATP-grasp domain-containing protein [Paenibacillus polysaccharolyticus]SCY21194.1 Biotin carboxylase [Paenibacillus polysaccharolyticus]
MRTVVINRLSPDKIDYRECLRGIVGEFILFTKPKHAEHFSSCFDKTISIENMDNSDMIYSKIVDLHQEVRIDHIIALTEFELIKVGQLRDYLNIDGQNEVSATAFRDKTKMKDYLKGKVETPTYMRINNIFELFEFKKKYGFPFVIKPVDGAGSMGVKVITDEDSYQSFLQDGVQSGLEVETFIKGDMYHIDGLFHKEQLLFACPSLYINGCLAFQDNKYLAAVMLDIENPLFKRLNQKVLDVLLSMPVPDHTIAFHAEFFHTNDDQIIFCEIASRVGGGKIADCVKYATGVDLLKEAFRAQCGLDVEIAAHYYQPLGYIQIPPKRGRLLAIDKEPPFDWVINCSIKNEHIGASFNGPESSADTIASLLVHGEGHKDIVEKFETLYNWYEKTTVWEIQEGQVK